MLIIKITKDLFLDPYRSLGYNSVLSVLSTQTETKISSYLSRLLDKCFITH